ncbi:MAG TPA: hypothetical protein VIQ30_18605 [Pseudonocardia sp.]
MRVGGRLARKLARYVIARDQGICWLCGHAGADTADHVIPVVQRPDLQFDPTNMKAAHGEERTVSVDGYACIGNYKRGDAAPPTDAVTSRRWR